MGFECESDKKKNTAYDIFKYVTPSDIQSQTYKYAVYILPTETNKRVDLTEAACLLNRKLKPRKQIF